jgi:hypothetical protein
MMNGLTGSALFQANEKPAEIFSLRRLLVTQSNGASNTADRAFLFNRTERADWFWQNVILLNLARLRPIG